MKKILVAIVLMFLAGRVLGEDIVVGTYNVEFFTNHFLGKRLATSRPSWMPRGDPQAQEILAAIRDGNDKANWETAQVILDPRFNPDVIVIQEGCKQEDLDYFTTHWLNKAYATDIQFPGNSERDQDLNMLIKPGFKILDKKDQYYLEPDSVKNERGDRLFARGPAFVLLQSPSGYKFWIGTNHQKSKYDNSKEITEWRNREAKRTHQIILDLEKTDTHDVIFMGDMNDELGIQEFELQGGGDVIENLVGPPQDGIFLATRKLAEAGQFSFKGYWRTEHRSLIDHVFVTKEMKDQIEDVQVFQNGYTQEASDHLPVRVQFKADAVGKN